MRKLCGNIAAFVLALLCATALFGCAGVATTGNSDASPSAQGSLIAQSAPSSAPGSAIGPSSSGASGEAATSVSEDGSYASRDEVALYVHLYGHLPGNYVSKTKARKAGWASEEGNLWDVLPGKSIGGGEFHDDEGKLPRAPGRRWTECDIDYQGGFRNAKRIVFSNDGLIFYTGNHYKTFEQLY